jgi:ribosomal protein S26
MVIKCEKCGNNMPEHLEVEERGTMNLYSILRVGPSSLDLRLKQATTSSDSSTYLRCCLCSHATKIDRKLCNTNA